MTFSPYQHVPGTPALNIFSLSSKQGEILCSTPGKFVSCGRSIVTVGCSRHTEYIEAFFNFTLFFVK